MWWIIIIIAVIILFKWFDIKRKQEVKRKAAQEYLDEQRNKVNKEDSEE